MPPATYVSKFLSPSSNNNISSNGNSNSNSNSNKSHSVRRSLKRKSIGGVSTRVVACGKDKGEFKKPDLRPHYPSFGTMGLIQPPTTATQSYSHGSPITMDTSNMDDRRDSLQDPPEPGQHGYHPVYGLRKSQSMGKSSGAAGGSGGKGPFSNAGVPPRMAFSPSPSKPPALFLDPNLPAPPPICTNSSLSMNRDSPTTTTTTSGSTPSTVNTAYSIPFGYDGMGVAPLSVVTKSFGAGSSGAGGQSTGASTPPVGEPLRESSSTARFKELIKRNVGLSASTAYPNPVAATASTNSSPIVGGTGLLTAPNGGPKTTSASTGAIGDLVSGYEQPSSMFSVSRMTGRKKKLTKKQLSDNGSPLSDEEDMPLSMRDPKQRKKQKKLQQQEQQQLLPEPSVRHHRLVASQALRDARESNLDHNVLIVELEPLPTKFVEAITGLSGGSPMTATFPSTKTSTMQSSTSVAAANLMMFPLLPMMANIIPSSTMASGTGSIASSSVYSSIQQQQQQQQRYQSSTWRSPRPLRVNGVNPLSERNFLFKSYQNSKFQGHYAFRIHGDQLEFGKLPSSFEQACSQYFREVDIAYRLLEKQAKGWRDLRKEALAKREKLEEKYWQRMAKYERRGPASSTSRDRSQERRDQEQKQEQKEKERSWETPSSQGEDYERSNNSCSFPSRSTSRTGTRSRSSSVSQLETGSTSSLPTFGMTKDESSSSSTELLLDRHPLLDSENRLTQSPTISNNISQEDFRQFPFGSNLHRSNSTGNGGGQVRGYSEPVHPQEPLLMLDDEVQDINNPSPEPYWDIENFLDDHNLPLWRQKELREEQLMQWAMDDDYWQKVECEHSIEAQEAQHGLELGLLELIKSVEYELFDSINQVEILNENRDAAFFSIANACRTNVMYLESPSLKLKYEFLNWIAISLMDHGEPDLQEEARREAAMDAFLKPGTLDLKSFELDNRLDEQVKCQGKTEKDLLLDLTKTRLSLLNEKMRQKREETMETMKQLEDVLSQLDNLDESAKNLSTTLLGAIESHEVQTALQPSPATGLTLAQTVDSKIKDVNERIVVCARIMGAARFNLNRLKYEIELEQRSIRLFRQYKIAIAIVSISVLTFFWLLYHRRHTAATAASALASAHSVTGSQSTPGFTLGSPSFSLARIVFGGGGGEPLHQHPV
ncbi:hypothetical protein BGX29_011697 [Mortierella sp. GBA35]|nr:hypothetical protein BGX29_011697 [Mortierella sp. GBA35]